MSKFPPTASDRALAEALCQIAEPSVEGFAEAIAQHRRAQQAKPRGTVEPQARPRDILIDALATLNGEDLVEVSPEIWRQASIAKAAILKLTPNVTADEIMRRAGNYKVIFPRIPTVGPMALLKHWATCATDGRKVQPPVKKPDNFDTW